jgi:hypothetical protein
MALKFRVMSKEERDGAFVLDVEGAVDKARVEELRARNVALAS